MTKHFKGHEQAKAWEINYQDGTRALQSYNTIVAEIDSNGWLLINGLYSMTTRKHIGWFMHEIGLTYQDAKNLYNDSMKMNIYTGEIRRI